MGAAPPLTDSGGEGQDFEDKGGCLKGHETEGG